MSEKKGHYYPLDLIVKVKHTYHGYIPSKNFKKWKRTLLKSREVAKQSFHPKRRATLHLNDILASIYSNVKIYTNSSRSGSTPNIKRLLYKIIPMEYFGSSVNRKRFFFVVNRILTQNRGEYIHTCVLYDRFDYNSILWLNPKQDMKTQVLQANILLLQTVVKPLIKRYYHLLNTFRNREYQTIPKGKVDSFLDRNIAKSIKSARMEKVKKAIKQPAIMGRLKYIPKKGISHLEHRPIVHGYLRNNSVLSAIRNNLKSLIKAFQIGDETDLFHKWKNFTEFNKGRRKLYAVKLDLLDAFGMVNIDELQTIIKNDDRFLTQGQKDFLIEILTQQYIHIRGKKQIYKWNHGLLQGTRLSPTFCELYLSYITFNRLKQFDKPNCFFHRTVDDMFFVSTCESEVADFELACFSMSILNEDKTQRFLNTEGEDPHIVFCGKMFNIVTRETCTAFEFKRGKELRSKFKFWNRKYQFSKDKAYEFIINSMQYAYVNFYFSKFELNTTCNQVKSVLKNIFDGMCFVGFKLFFVVESIEYLFSTLEDRCKTVLRGIDYIVSTYPPILHKTIKKYRGANYKNIFSYKLITFLCLKAFIVVFQRRHFKYKCVIAQMKNRTKGMSIPNFKDNIDIKYFSKLPVIFENISMRRTAVLDGHTLKTRG